ncbi:MAG: hypothetical protein KC591_02865, partial [Gemmatimonadetes bacterium]|nr:hypothetical protein [Gemmatimonadota bacterium]
MMDAGLARLESCLDTAEIRVTLDEIRPSVTPWSVWVPNADGFACLFGNDGGASGLAEPDLTARLAAWWSATANESDESNLLPLRFRDETYAALWVGSDEDLAWWRDVARVLGAGLVKAQLYESASRESASSGTKLDALNEA